MNTKWKKILCLPLSCVLMMGLVSGCGSSDAAPSTEPTATEPDPNKPLKVFTIGNSASLDFLIPAGTALENALSSYLEETDIHRDYVHLSDLSRVIASYVWYCKLAGIEKLEQIKLDAIPKAFLKSTADKTQDRILTQTEKAIILESVNNALANPLEVMQSQYTKLPAE